MYRLSLLGEVAHSWWKTFVPFGIALVATTVLIFAVGLPNEEGQLGSLLYDMGLDAEAATQISDGIDFLMRISIGMIAAFAFLGGLLACIAMYFADRETSRSLVLAADNGAATAAVPVPSQVERVVRDNFPHLQGFLLVTGIAAGGFFGIGMLVALFTGFGEGAAVCAAGGVVVALLLLWHRSIRNRAVPEHQARRRRIAQHWPTQQEAAAWDAARTAEKLREQGSDEGLRPHALDRTGRITTSITIGLVVVVIPLFYVLTLTMYPEAHRTGPNQWELGRRIDRGPTIEGLVDVGMLLLPILLISIVLVPAFGIILQSIGRNIDRRRLMAALNDPAASAPDKSLLQWFIARQASPLASVLAVFAGIGLVFGISIVLLSSMETDGFYADAGDMFAPFRFAAIIACTLSVLFLALALLINAVRGVRDLTFRNQILERWPVLPEPKMVTVNDSDSAARSQVKRPIPATVGPALTPGGDSDLDVDSDR